MMNLEVNQAIKVLEVNPKDGSLRSCHGGDFTWDPPTPNEDDGSWTPSAWTEPVIPNLCHRGYHLTDDPNKWWGRNEHLRAYLVEFMGSVEGSFEDSRDRKISVESCRLLRPLTASELAGYNILIGGKHTIDGNTVVLAYGNTEVFAIGG